MIKLGLINYEAYVKVYVSHRASDNYYWIETQQIKRISESLFSMQNLVEIRIHTGEKQYKCKHSPEVFNQYPYLIPHIGIHSRGKP